MATTTTGALPTRASLIHRLKNWQDQASWQDFFDTYWKLIYNVAKKHGLTEVEAEDVVQETMVTVSKQMPAFKYDPSIGSFKGWLLKVTRCRIADQIQKRMQNAESLPSEADSDALVQHGEEFFDSAGLDVEAFWETEWKTNLLEAATIRVKRRLDPQKYQIFDCCSNKGWDALKVASAFNISVDQVYLAKHRITQMIKDEVERLQNSMI